MVISKVLQTKNNSKYLIEYSGKVMRSLVLLLPKMSGYVKTWTKIEDLKNIALDTTCIC